MPLDSPLAIDVVEIAASSCTPLVPYPIQEMLCRLDARLEAALEPVSEPARSTLRKLIDELRSELEAARVEACNLRVEDQARRNAASSASGMLPQMFRNVVTIGDELEVVEAAAAAEEIVGHLCAAETDDSVALGALDIAAQRLCSAVSAQINARLDTPSVFAECDAVQTAGTADFAGVYDVMWSRIQRNEVVGIDAFMLAAEHARDLVGDSKAEQRVTDIATLVVQAFHARPVFAAFVRELTTPETLGFVVRTPFEFPWECRLLRP